MLHGQQGMAWVTALSGAGWTSKVRAREDQLQKPGKQRAGQRPQVPGVGVASDSRETLKMRVMRVISVGVHAKELQEPKYTRTTPVERGLRNCRKSRREEECVMASDGRGKAYRVVREEQQEAGTSEAGLTVKGWLASDHRGHEVGADEGLAGLLHESATTDSLEWRELRRDGKRIRAKPFDPAVRGYEHLSAMHSAACPGRENTQNKNTREVGKSEWDKTDWAGQDAKWKDHRGRILLASV